ncbi:hypothetical protein D3C79_488030 [compost metagenome]
MPQPVIAIELEAINRDGETQEVRDSGLTVHGYSIYLRVERAPSYRLATWVFDSETVGPAYSLAKRLSLALAIPLTVLIPAHLMPVGNESTGPTVE